MTDMSGSIIPKSDQLNSDSLISGPLTIEITKVSADHGSSEQPILVHYKNGEGRPWKPCKSMRRVLVQVWGTDGSAYVGRSLTLYRDPTVTWGGMQVGGLRISHMSDIDSAVTMALTATKQSRKPFTVKPLATPKEEPAEVVQAAARIEAAKGADSFKAWYKTTGASERAVLKSIMEELQGIAEGASGPAT